MFCWCEEDWEMSGIDGAFAFDDRPRETAAMVNVHTEAGRATLRRRRRAERRARRQDAETEERRAGDDMSAQVPPWAYGILHRGG